MKVGTRKGRRMEITLRGKEKEGEARKIKEQKERKRKTRRDYSRM